MTLVDGTEGEHGGASDGRESVNRRMNNFLFFSFSFPFMNIFFLKWTIIKTRFSL